VVLALWTSLVTSFLHCCTVAYELSVPSSATVSLHGVSAALKTWHHLYITGTLCNKFSHSSLCRKPRLSPSTIRHPMSVGQQVSWRRRNRSRSHSGWGWSITCLWASMMAAARKPRSEWPFLCVCVILCVCLHVCFALVYRKKVCSCVFVYLSFFITVCWLLTYMYVCTCANIFFFLMGVCVYFHMCVRPAVGDKVSV